MPQGIETLLSSPAPRYPTPVKDTETSRRILSLSAPKTAEIKFDPCSNILHRTMKSSRIYRLPVGQQGSLPDIYFENLHSAVKQNDCSDYNGKNLRDNADSDQSADWDYIRPYNTPFLLKFLTLPQVDKNRPKITTKEGK